MARQTIGDDAVPNLVDLERYPILAQDSVHWRALLAEGQAQIASRGACVLPGFIRPKSVAALAAEAARVAPLAYGVHRGRELYTYSETPNPALPPGHPRRHRMHNLYGFVGCDLLPPGSGLRRLYEWNRLTSFVGALLGFERLHRYVDPVAALTISVMEDGGHQGWHFDLNDFIVSLLLRKPAAGGTFEYVPMIRGPDEENYGAVARILAGDRAGILQLPLEEGTLALFKGRHSLHQVTAVAGGPRLMALLAYDALPDQREPDDNLLAVYGRTRDPAERAELLSRLGHDRRVRKRAWNGGR